MALSPLKQISSRGDSFIALLSGKVNNDINHCSAGFGIAEQAHHMCPRTPPVCRYEESSDMLENRSELLWSGE
jgi:hypothetical protein